VTSRIIFLSEMGNNARCPEEAASAFVPDKDIFPLIYRSMASLAVVMPQQEIILINQRKVYGENSTLSRCCDNHPPCILPPPQQTKASPARPLHHHRIRRLGLL